MSFRRGLEDKASAINGVMQEKQFLLPQVLGSNPGQGSVFVSFLLFFLNLVQIDKLSYHQMSLHCPCLDKTLLNFFFLMRTTL